MKPKYLRCIVAIDGDTASGGATVRMRGGFSTIRQPGISRRMISRTRAETGMETSNPCIGVDVGLLPTAPVSLDRGRRLRQLRPEVRSELDEVAELRLRARLQERVLGLHHLGVDVD